MNLPFPAAAALPVALFLSAAPLRAVSPLTPGGGAGTVSAEVVTEELSPRPDPDGSSPVEHGLWGAHSGAEGDQEMWSLGGESAWNPSSERLCGKGKGKGGPRKATYRVIFKGKRPRHHTNPIPVSEFQLDGTLVPEPSAAILGLAGGMVMCRRRR